MTKLVLAVALLIPPVAAFAQAPARFNIPVEYFTLPNGLKVVVSEDRSAPVVFVEVMYNIGFRIEPKGRTGFAHLFEHMMFQGSGQVKKIEHISMVQQAGGVVNGSTRLDYTNYFEVLPSNGLDLALWLEADRMRSLDVSADNLKNQQNVVSEEVRVNVLNQPHASFEWLDLWQRANTNWANAHNFYGDLAELENAKVYARGLFVIQNATQGGLSNTLNTMYSFGLPNDYPETFQKNVSSLSGEAVKTAAQMLLGSENSVIVIVGDYAKVKDQLGAFQNISFVDISGKPIAPPQ